MVNGENLKSYEDHWVYHAVLTKHPWMLFCSFIGLLFSLLGVLAYVFTGGVLSPGWGIHMIIGISICFVLGLCIGAVIDFLGN